MNKNTLRKLILQIVIISLISLYTQGYAYERSMNMLGEYEQGPFSIVTSSNSKSRIMNTLTFRQFIPFKQQFKKKPQVIITIQSIVLQQGINNDYQVKLLYVNQEGFEFSVKTYQKDSEFNISLLYTAYEQNKYLRVYYFSEASTPKLYDQQDSQKNIRKQDLQKIQIDDFKASSISCSAFLLGVKQAGSSGSQQDISISANAQPIENESKIEVFIQTWNNIKIESASVVVVVWDLPQQVQGDWKGLQYDPQRNQIKNHQWTNTNKSDRFALLTFDMNLQNQKHVSSLKLYGIHGYDIREGPLALISKDFNLNTEESVATVKVGTTGKSKLVAAWITGVLLIDDIQEVSQGLSPLVISFIIAGSVIGIFAIFSLFYLKFFKSKQNLTHKKFGKDQKGYFSTNSQSSNGLYDKNNVQDSSVLDPNGTKKNYIGLLSRGIISSYKNTSRSFKTSKQPQAAATVIVEMSEEQTSKNNQNCNLTFQEVLDEEKRQRELQQAQSLNQTIVEKDSNNDQDDTERQSYDNNLGTLESEQQIQQFGMKSSLQFSKTELMGGI